MYLEIKEFDIVIDISKILYLKKEEQCLTITFNFGNIEENIEVFEFENIDDCEYFYNKIKNLLQNK